MTPVLILLIGPQGSGKTTWAKRFIDKNKGILYISTDAIRSQIGSGEYDQTVNDKVYKLMEKKTEEALRDEQSVMLDATFIKRSWREKFTNIGRRYSAKLVAHVFNVDRNTLIKRIQKRANSGGLNVPSEIVDKYIKEFEPPLPGEFDIIINH